MKRILSKIYGVPFAVKNYWPYCHEDFKVDMKAKGFQVGGIPSNIKVGGFVSFLWNESHEFIYVVTKEIKLKGSDFLPGTDKEYNLKFYSRIKSRD